MQFEDKELADKALQHTISLVRNAIEDAVSQALFEWNEKLSQWIKEFSLIVSSKLTPIFEKVLLTVSNNKQYQRLKKKK